MKLVVQVKLLPNATQEAALRETLALCNRAANLASRRAFATGITGKQALQRLVYGEVKAMGLSAQPAIHVAKEARFAADTNHRIAKSIVAEAERTSRGIALEDLQGGTSGRSGGVGRPEVHLPDVFGLRARRQE